MAKTAQCLAQRMSAPREFDLIQLQRVGRNLVGKLRAAIRFRRQEHIKNITKYVDSDLAGDPVSRKSTTGHVAREAIW